jgi:hypothetical protein
MSPEDILRRVNHPDVPKFVFGSKELAAWTGDHRNPQNCKCENYSGPYVVIHRSLNPAKQPGFPRVVLLERWLQRAAFVGCTGTVKLLWQRFLKNNLG